MTVCADDMPLGLQDLKSHLWDCAEILRGSAVDRTDWKAYIPSCAKTRPFRNRP